MAIYTQYQCDGCGREKREANHWFALRVSAGVLELTRFERMRDLGPGAEFEILCGQECVAKKISAWMGTDR
jgi:hypothetical protein